MGNFDSDQFTCIKMADLVHSELIWAVYSAVQVLETSPILGYSDLAKGWQSWLDYTKSTAAKVCQLAHLL